MRLKQMIIIPVLALLLISTVAITVLNYILAKNTVDRMVDNIVDSGLDTLIGQVDRATELEKAVMEEMNEKNIGLTRGLAEIIRLNAQLGTLALRDVAFNQRITGILGVSEIHIVDSGGVIVGGNIEGYYGFDFNSGDQTRPFLRILDDPAYELAQDPQPNATEGKMFQYIGAARTDEKGIVQVGHTAQSVQAFQDILDVSRTAADMRVGSTGRASILLNGVIAYTQKTERIGRDVNNEAWYKQVSSGRGKAWIDIDGEKLYAGYNNAGGTTMLVMFPKDEYDGYLTPVRNVGIIGSAVSLLIMFVLIIVLTGHVVRPINELTDKLEAVALGDLSASLTTGAGDAVEIRSLAKSFSRVTDNIRKRADVIEAMARGDYSMTVQVLSEKDTMNKAINSMLESTNSIMEQINGATVQVAGGAKQIADGSQTLAQGSTEQAASIEQLSSSIREIADKTKTNAEMAGKAAVLANTIMSNAEKGSRQMDEMMAAVKDINQASQQISKVIKVIDDIAFQTNILALNAAVEAARAGQHGKGFAVVAEEVRSLASKSAEAAKETGNLIVNSTEKAELGSRIANETSASLAEIVEGIKESSQLVSQIARSSDEQSAGITQINQGVDQVAQVVQQNSATAEESAAAAEEMSGQSAVLESLIAQFNLRAGSRISMSPRPASHATLPAAARRMDGGDFGKY